MKLLVCGGRTFGDYHALKAAIERIAPTSVAHGGAKGADALADRIARDLGIPVSVHRADWHRYGRAAGMIRNGVMLAHYKPDVVLAAPGGPGTANMVARARQAGVAVMGLGEGPLAE